MKFDNAKPRVGRDNTKLEDLIEMLKLGDGKWVTIRMLDSDILPVKRHWINIIGGKSGKEVKIPKFCVSYDTKNDTDLDGVTCPYCDVGSNEVFYLANVISRELQEDEPAKKKSPTKSETKSGFKQPGSETWTPVRVMRIPSSLAQKIQGLKELNKVKNKKTQKVEKYSVADPKNGCDISIKYDSKQSGTDKYQVQLGERSKLSDEEKELLQFELSDEMLVKCGREDEKTAKKEMSRMQLAGAEEAEGDDDDDDDDDVSLGKKSKGKKAKKDDKKSKSKKSRDEDDDDDDDDDDEDEDEAPAKKSKGKPAKGKKKPVDDDDDDEDEDDEDEDDEDEDDAPKSKKSKAKPSKKSKKPDDDDDDEDDEDEDDDEDSDDDEDDEDSDDDDDDGDDDDAEDDDDEDDDEPPAKSKKSKGKPAKADKKAKGKVKKKSKKSDDDDDDDDDDVPF